MTIAVARSEKLYLRMVAVLAFFSRRFSRVTVEGLEHIPKTGGAILYANHVSYADPLILGAVLGSSGRHARAMGKASIFKLPIVGKLLLKMGHVPVYRNSERAVDSLREAIRQVQLGEVLALYPEGTIPRNGEWLGDFKTGAARLALATGVPVVPIAQVGAEKILPVRKEEGPLRHLLKALLRRPKVKIVIGEPFIPLFATEGRSPENREQVQAASDELRLAMMGLLRELKPGCPTPLQARPR